MSHEMRTPLHAMLGFAHMLAEEVAELELPRSLLDKLDNLTYAGRILDELIGSTLDLASIEAGKLAVAEAVIEIRELFLSCYRMYAEVARTKGVSLLCHFDDALPDRIVSDGTLIKQILANLLGNAIKFTPTGKRIEVRAERADDNILVLQVSDQGIGIPSDKLDAIFESFEQVDRGISRQYGGTGLGLPLTKKIAELLGGELSVDSALEQGTTFTIRLPLTETAQAALPTRHRSPVRFASDQRVLMVEDNDLNRKVARGTFKLLGLDIDVAEDGQEGVRMAIELEPDLIFMDLHMPVMDGLAATRRIRAHPVLGDTPIIAMSADAFHEHQQAAFDASVSEYLTKPLSSSKLSAVLERYLRVQSPSDPDTGDA
jgi:CheY-like chemotaxis protein